MPSNELIKVIALTVALVMVVKNGLSGRLIKKGGVIDHCLDGLAYLTFMFLLMAYIHNANQH